MPLFKHTLIFEGPGHGGSETLYFQRPTGTNPQAALAYVGEIKNKRRPLLGAQWRIKGERVTQLTDDAGLPLKRATAINRFDLVGTQAQNAAETNVSLQVYCSDYTVQHKKLMFQVGPWGIIFPRPDVFDPSVPGAGAWQSYWGSYNSLVRSLGMGWLASILNSRATITGYQFSSGTGLTTYTLGGAGIVFPEYGVPYRVSVEFPLSRSPLDGVQLVIPTDANTVTTAKPRPARPFTVNGQMRLLGSQFISMSDGPNGVPANCNPQVPMTRKRGRPLLVSRGRLANQVNW